jgi:hypothetical protein
MTTYTIARDELDVAYLGADLAHLDTLPDGALAQEISARFDAAVDRDLDPHDDPRYLRALLVQTGRHGFRAGQLMPLRIRPFGI